MLPGQAGGRPIWEVPGRGRLPAVPLTRGDIVPGEPVASGVLVLCYARNDAPFLVVEAELRGRKRWFAGEPFRRRNPQSLTNMHVFPALPTLQAQPTRVQLHVSMTDKGGGHERCF
jgi:hypothetical protein